MNNPADSPQPPPKTTLHDVALDLLRSNAEHSLTTLRTQSEFIDKSLVTLSTSAMGLMYVIGNNAPAWSFSKVMFIMAWVLFASSCLLVVFSNILSQQIMKDNYNHAIAKLYTLHRIESANLVDIDVFTNAIAWENRKDKLLRIMTAVNVSCFTLGANFVLLSILFR